MNGNLLVGESDPRLRAHNAVTGLGFALAEIIADGDLVVVEPGGDVTADFSELFEVVVGREGCGRGVHGEPHDSVVTGSRTLRTQTRRWAYWGSFSISRRRAPSLWES